MTKWDLLAALALDQRTPCRSGRDGLRNEEAPAMLSWAFIQHH
jgi:hypothetical protein